MKNNISGYYECSLCITGYYLNDMNQCVIVTKVISNCLYYMNEKSC